MHKFLKFGTIVEGITTWQEQFSFLQSVSVCVFSQTLLSIRQNSVFQNMLQWNFCVSPARWSLTKLSTGSLFVIRTKITLIHRTSSVFNFLHLHTS